MRKLIDLIEGRVDELFNRTLTNISWIFDRGSGRVSADFEVDGLPYEAVFVPRVLRGDNYWYFLFHKKERKTGSVSEALPVFNHVIGIIEQFLKTYRPEEVQFEGVDSRAKLYASLLRRYKSSIEAIGYNVNILDNSKAGLRVAIVRADSLTEDDHEHTPPKYDANDDPHYDALSRTGFFGEQAAGCIAMAKTTGRIMLVLRSAEVLEPYTWGNMGGAHHADERPVVAAERELHEESGYTGKASMIPLLVFQKNSFRYSNFLAIVEDEFVPHLGWEATDYKWCEPGDWPSPLHFGLKALFSDPESMKAIAHYSKLFHGEK